MAPGETTIVLSTTEAHYTGEAGKKYASHFPDPYTDIVGRCFRDRVGRWLSAADKVIEFGCGNGRNILAIQCAEKAGYDLNEHSRDAARAAGLRIFDRVEEIPKGYWTAVICNHVLEHVPSPLETLAVLKSLLAPQGKLLLTVPLEGHLMKLVPRDRDIDRHLFCWSPTTMRNLLAVAAFTPRSIVVRTAACEDTVEPLARISWTLFKLGVWSAGTILRRREMMCVAEPR